MEKDKEICQECHARVGVNERHTYSHCLVAKAYPDKWLDIVKQITSSSKKRIVNGKR